MGLKIIALFSTDQVGITSPRQVVKICDKAVLELKEYCESKGENRFTNLLLRLSPLRSLQPDVLEELFFAGLIGNVQIDSVVPYILKMESSEYHATAPNGDQQFKEAKNPHSFFLHTEKLTIIIVKCLDELELKVSKPFLSDVLYFVVQHPMYHHHHHY